MSDQKPTVQDRIAQLQADQEKIEKLEHELETTRLNMQEWINKCERLTIMLKRINIVMKDFNNFQF
jgi:hypothetical protein